MMLFANVWILLGVVSKVVFAYTTNNKINVRQIKHAAGAGEDQADGADQEEDHVEGNPGCCQAPQVQFLGRGGH